MKKTFAVTVLLLVLAGLPAGARLAVPVVPVLSATNGSALFAPRVAEEERIEAPALAIPDDLPSVTADLQTAPLMFIENRGQFDEQARFRARGDSRVLWLAEDGLWFTVVDPSPVDTLKRSGVQRAEAERDDEPLRGANIKLSFVGANPHPGLEPFNRLDTHVSYFTGNDPTQWHADVPVWGGVRYVDLYPGVDLEVASTEGHWAWRLLCEASCRAALQDVRLRVEGADAVALDDDHLHLTTAVGDLNLPLLAIEDVVSYNRPEILDREHETYEVSSPFSPTPLASSLSPQNNLGNLIYSTYLGGNGEDTGEAIAVDGAGSAYVTGWTESSDFPTTPGAFDVIQNSKDVFVVKLNPAGSGQNDLAYATFLGGDSGDLGYAIAVEKAGNAYVTGQTSSDDFPTTSGAFDTSEPVNQAVFLAKLSADGTDLAYSTFLDGTYWEHGNAIAVDGNGIVYVAGGTRSPNFPHTPGAFDTTCGTDGDCDFDGSNHYKDTFVVKLNPAGGGSDDLLYATFLGGNDLDTGDAIAVDGAGNAYVTGWTYSSDFPATVGAFDTTCGTDGNCNFDGAYSYTDAFVLKLNPVGSGQSDLLYATFLGGSDHDRGQAIALGGTGSAYVTGYTGYTDSSNFPTTPGAFDTSYNGWGDAFVVKLEPDGADLVYSTFLGGSGDDEGHGIAVDPFDRVYVTGSTESFGFPTTPGAFDTSLSGGDDVFVVRMNAAGSQLTYATFLGGRSSECSSGVAVRAGGVYVTGNTWSSESRDFPTTAGAFDTDYNSGGDAFVALLGLHLGKESDPMYADRGDPITYTLTYVHPASAGGANVLIEDMLPTYTSYLPGFLWASSGNPVYDPATRRITWNGSPAPGEDIQVRYAISGTCETPPLFDTIENAVTATVNSAAYHAVAVTHIPTVPYTIRTSTSSFLPTSVFTPGHTVLLYTESPTLKSNCCASCDMDQAYIVVNGITWDPLKMENEGAGLNQRAHADFIADDCHHSLWFTPTYATSYTLDLYVVPTGTQFTSGLPVMDSLELTPAPNPELAVLTDLRELFSEFNRTDPNSASADKNHNCIRDYYEAVERMQQYASAHKGVVVDVRQDGYGSDLQYTAQADRRNSMPSAIDKLVSWLPLGRNQYVAIIGDDAVVPFYRHPDPQLNNEKRYRAGNSHGVATLIDTHQNLIMTDVPYSTLDTETPDAPKPDLALGRIFAPRPLSLIEVIDAYEQEVVVGAQTGSSFVFNIAKEYDKAGVLLIDWPANTKAAAVDVLRAKGYTTFTTNLVDRGKPHYLGWMDAEAGVNWLPRDVASALETAGRNRLTVLNSHARHYRNTAPLGNMVYARDLDNPPPYPGTVFVNFGCHGGYSTEYDSRPGPLWNYYDDALVRAALDRNFTYHANTTYGWTSGTDVIIYHDRIHRQFLVSLLDRFGTTGQARLAAQRSYYAFRKETKLNDRDTIALYGTELYGLPTQPIRRAPPAVLVRSISEPLGAAGVSALQAPQVLTVSLEIPHFRVTTDGENHTLFEVPHGGELTALGNGPYVPLLIHSFHFPADATGLTVTLVSTATSVYSETVELSPQQVGNRTYGVSTVPFTGTEPYPATAFWTTIYTDARGVELTLSAVPLRYDPVTGQTTLYNQMEFRVEYNLPATGVQIGSLSLNHGAPVSIEQADLPITMTVTTASTSPLTLLWVIEDPGGAPIRSGAAVFTPTVGTNTVEWRTDSQGWLPGPKTLHAIMEDESEVVVATAQKDFVVQGRSLTLSTDKSIYGTSDAHAIVRAEVRDESGGAVSGLTGSFIQELDGFPLTVAWHEGDGYTATLDLTSLSTGIHALNAALSGGPTTQATFGVDREPPTSTVSLKARYGASFTLALELWDDVSSVEAITVEYRLQDAAMGSWVGDWTTWMSAPTAWDYESGAPANLEPTFGPTQPMSVDLMAYYYCFRTQAVDAIGNQEAEHAGADLCVGPLQLYLPLVLRNFVP